MPILGSPNWKMRDAFWYMPDDKRNPLKEFQAAMYGIAVAALGTLSTIAAGPAIDVYSPISGNAKGSQTRISWNAFDLVYQL